METNLMHDKQGDQKGDHNRSELNTVLIAKITFYGYMIFLNLLKLI